MKSPIALKFLLSGLALCLAAAVAAWLIVFQSDSQFRRDPSAGIQWLIKDSRWQGYQRFRIMRTSCIAIKILCLLGFILVGISCNKSTSDKGRMSANTLKLMAPQDARKSQLASSNGDPALDPSIELDQTINILISKPLIAADTIDRVRGLLNEVARREESEPMCIAAKCAFEVESERDQLLVLSVVNQAFPDTSSKISLASKMPASRLRTSAVRRLCANELKGDLRAMQRFYEVMPLGEDRSLVASSAAAIVLSNQGLSAALDYIEKLEMPEERYRALDMANMSNQPGWHEEQNIQKFRKIIDSLLPEDKKRF